MMMTIKTNQTRRSGSNRTIEGRDAIGLYLDSISKTPLLTAQEEVDLAKRIEAGLYAQQILDGKIRTSVTCAAEELKLVVDEGHEAFELFVRANLRLVVAVARKYGHGAMPLLDLVQEGNTGLIRAVKKFDYTKGFKFSTYATWWIRQAITRGIAHGSQIVKLPVHIAEQINQVTSTRSNLTRRLGREPELHELASEMGMPVNTVHDLIRLGRAHASLDAPLSDDGDTTLGDLMAAQPEPSEELSIEDKATLNAMLNQLDDRSADIVRRRYGLAGGSVAKLADIGDAWGITAERVRQIERAALKSLQRMGVGELDDVAV